MKPPEPKEADITKSIRNYLKKVGIFHWKVWQGLGSAKGVSDILGCYRGRLLAIEVKTRKGKLSEHQDRFIQSVIANGGIAFVARSVDDVIKHLEGI